MTADEMFAEIGYTQKCDVKCGLRFDFPCENGFGSIRAIVIDVSEKTVEKGEYPRGFGCPMTFCEVKAAAKLLEEMEGQE